MKTILVIDDDEQIRAYLLRLLKITGFQAVSAEDGASGVQLVKAYLPDLVLCDVMMPHLDGYGVLAQLRQDPDTATIPLIFLSAKGDRSNVRQGMNLGADDYLIKPFTSTELVEAIAGRLEKQATITQPYVDEMKRAAENLTKAAYNDPLTNLPNRILLRQWLQEAMRRVDRQQQKQAQTSEPSANTVYSIGVFYLNLDRFRSINHNFGHRVGDELLKAVAQRLSDSLGKQNTVARLGGDEFGVILEKAYQKQEIEDFAQQILAVIAAPYLLDGQEIHIQVSLGIALYPTDGHDADQLLTHADAARRCCRKQGGNSYQFYTSEMIPLSAERQWLETDLLNALGQSEFQLYYQPQVNVITGRLIGMEALLRWQHSQRGMILPSIFLPVAEELGLMVSIGEWVLQTACAQIQAWQSLSLMPLRVAVNLSARQFRHENLVAMIRRVLNQTGLDPTLLVLELTEASIMEDVKMTIATLQALKTTGVEIAIDDFGTGYSSLNYLRRFPIDTLKIDRSFVAQVTENPQDAAITSAVIAMAQSLKLKVIAEGVETPAQLAFLRQHGCQAAQGNIYSPPQPASEVATLLSGDQRISIA
jgi:diguanylate cyclase